MQELDARLKDSFAETEGFRALQAAASRLMEPVARKLRSEDSRSLFRSPEAQPPTQLAYGRVTPAPELVAHPVDVSDSEGVKPPRLKRTRAALKFLASGVVIAAALMEILAALRAFQVI